jgi:chromosome segregation ATPase
MGAQKRDISTGVDKLVKLISEKGKLSLNEASKNLGMPTSVIEEWAHFLEKKGIINLKYLFTNTYLLRKDFSEKEIKKRKKDFVNKKEGIVRKSETFLKSMHKNFSFLTDLKEDYMSFRKEIEKELKHVNIDYKEIEEFHKLKRELEKEILEEQNLVKNKVHELHTDLAKSNKEFQEMIAKIKKEENTLEEDINCSDKIKTEEARMLKELNNIQDNAKRVMKKIMKTCDDKKQASFDLKTFEKRSKILKNVLEKRKKEFPTIITKLESEEKRMNSKYKEILNKYNDSEAISKKDALGLKTTLAKSQNKINEIDTIINKVFSEYSNLEVDLKKVLDEAKSIKVLKGENLDEHITPLNEKLEKLSDQKDKFHQHLHKLRFILKK